MNLTALIGPGFERAAFDPLRRDWVWDTPQVTGATPCMAVSPFPVEQNYRHWPAHRCRATVGLQVVGRPGAEEAVLALAAAVQRQNPISTSSWFDS
jgi:Asp-tRNA(Asn)/Glu-tRNA(Gln) amidotransferase A subunit family amidase